MNEAFLINVSGLVGIIFVIWWFWIAENKKSPTTNESIIEIIVANGVYHPAHITTVACKTITLRFIRKDPSPCASAVIFTDLGISAELDLEGATDIVLTPQTPGEYPFTCEMAMYQGKLLVKPGCH